MICNKCGNEVKEREEICINCNNKINENEATNVERKSSKKFNKKHVYIIAGALVTAIIVIISICVNSFTNKKDNEESLTNQNNQEQQEEIEKEETPESKPRFANTTELRNFYSKGTLSSGEEITVTGLDLVFGQALQYKFPTIKTETRNNLYTDFITAIGPNEIKGFIIDDDIIGGYVIYHNYKQKTETSREGYYRYYQAFAIKVTNWNGLNNMRNNQLQYARTFR